MASRVFTIPEFDKFARKARISDEEVLEAVARADRGLVYADLGENVIKLAIARPNESARHGFRTIVGYKRETRAIFFIGFAKNDAGNVTDRALRQFKATAATLLALSDEDIDVLVSDSSLREIETNKRAD